MHDLMSKTDRKLAVGQQETEIVRDGIKQATGTSAKLNGILANTENFLWHVKCMPSLNSPALSAIVDWLIKCGIAYS